MGTCVSPWDVMARIQELGSWLVSLSMARPQSIIFEKLWWFDDVPKVKKGKCHTQLQKGQEGMYFLAGTLLGAGFGTNEATFEELCPAYRRASSRQLQITGHGRRHWDSKVYYISLRKRRIGKPIAIFHWWGGYRGNRARFFSDIYQEGTKNSVCSLHYRKLWSNIRKENVLSKVHCSGRGQRGCSSPREHFQSSAGQGLEQPHLSLKLALL